MIGPDDIKAAAAKLDGVAHPTPVFTSRTLDRKTDAQVYLKAECFQRSGSFKFRGAYNALAALPATARARGAVCFSTGNHGLAFAFAFAAKLFGIPATVVLPQDTAEKKQETPCTGGIPDLLRPVTRGPGGDCSHCGEPVGRSAHHAMRRRRCDRRPGNGGARVDREDRSLDVLLVSVGGGGLMAGSAVAAKAMLPAIRVIGVEPRQGNDMQLSLAAGRRVTISPPTTILDGQVNTAPARLSFAINQKLSDGIVLIDDHEVVDAMALLFDRLKVVAEPSGAAPLAALVSGKVEAAGRRVGVILSGGNIGIDRFCTLMSQLATPIRE